MPLAKALKNWSHWGLASEPALVKRFTSGQNHDTGLIAVDGQHYVLKVFSHSFERAIAAERIASQLGVSPRLLYAEENIALFDYIPSPNEPQITLIELAQTLSKVHSHNAHSLERFDLLKFVDHYLSTADEPTKAWHKILLPVLNCFINDTTPWCFCHNDLVQENCLVAEKLVLIDWEFGLRHNPWFDLAAIVLYFRLDDNEAREFLGLYKEGWQEKVHQRIFYTSQISLLWSDLMWNLNKFGNEYRLQNTERFERLQKLATKLDIKLPS